MAKKNSEEGGKAVAEEEEEIDLKSSLWEDEEFKERYDDEGPQSACCQWSWDFKGWAPLLRCRSVACRSVSGQSTAGLLQLSLGSLVRSALFQTKPLLKQTLLLNCLHAATSA